MIDHLLEIGNSVGMDSKIQRLLKVLKKIGKEKVVLFTSFLDSQKVLAMEMAVAGYSVSLFNGKMNPAQKEQAINEFRADKQILICTDAGSEGRNLQFSHIIVNYDLPWNPMSVEQRIGRLDRIGQERDMYIYSFATKGTMEEHVVDLIINKMCCVGLVIGELPIILFNLGLDGSGKSGKNKIEEKLMASFIEGKGTLDFFARGVDEIADEIALGMKDYEKEKVHNKKFFDE